MADEKKLVQKRKNPKFRRSEHTKKRLKDVWRKPRGMNSKIKIGQKNRGEKPHPGYGSPLEIKGLNRFGFREILVENLSQLNSINPKKETALISGRVGRKKRIEIMEEAVKKGIRVANPGIKMG